MDICQVKGLLSGALFLLIHGEIRNQNRKGIQTQALFRFKKIVLFVEGCFIMHVYFLGIRKIVSAQAYSVHHKLCSRPYDATVSSNSHSYTHGAVAREITWFAQGCNRYSNVIGYQFPL